MKRSLKFIVVLMALLALMGFAQGAMTGACKGGAVPADLPCGY